MGKRYDETPGTGQDDLVMYDLFSGSDAAHGSDPFSHLDLDPKAEWALPHSEDFDFVGAESSGSIMGRIERTADWLITRWESICDIPDRRERLKKQVAVIALSAIAQVTVIGGGIFAATELMDSDSVSSERPAATALPAESITDREARLEASVLVEKPEYVDSYPFLHDIQQDRNPDPTYRASSASITGGEDSTSNFVLGSGSIVEVNGELVFVTIGHVANSLTDDTQDPERTATIFLPGIGYTTDFNISEASSVDLSPSLSLSSYQGNGDPNMVIPLSDDLQDLIRIKQEAGEFQPLLPTNEIPEVGDIFQVVQPETGDVIDLRFRGIADSSSIGEHGSLAGSGVFDVNEFYDDPNPNPDTVKNTLDYLCQGDSGSGVVNLDNGTIFGTVSSTTPIFNNENGALCGIRIVVPGP